MSDTPRASPKQMPLEECLSAVETLRGEQSTLQSTLQEVEYSFSRVENAHQEWESSMDVIRDLIFMHDSECRIIRCNQAYADRAGQSVKEVLGKLYWEVFPRRNGPTPGCLRALQHTEGEQQDEEFELDGAIYRSRAFAVNDAEGSYLYSVHILEDVTANRRAEAALQASEYKNRILLENLPQKIFYKDANSVYVACNQHYADDLKIVPAEIVGKTDFEFYPAELAEKYRADDQRLMAQDQVEELDERYLQNGQEAWVHTVKTPIKDGGGKVVGILGIFWDITAHKQAEQRQKLDYLRMQASLQMDKMVGAEDRVILDFALEQAMALTGSRYGFISKVSVDRTRMVVQAWSRDVLPVCAMHDQSIEFEIASAGIWAEPLRTREPIILNDYRAAHPQKHGIPAGHVAVERFMGVPVFDGDDIVLLIAVSNKQNAYNQADADRLHELMKEAWHRIQRNGAERAMRHSNRALRSISGGNQALIRAQDETALLREMCRVAVEQGGYHMAWVGYVRDGADKRVQPLASYGLEAGYLESANISWDGDERGQGITGRAIRTGLTQASQNIASDPSMVPWRELAQQHGYAASISLPLLDDGKCFGVFVLYSTEPDCFAAEEVELLEEMAGDLAFGIQTLRLRQAHQQHEQRLQQGMLTTVKAIAGIVEMRDPYTSGHQARVAEIAQAIAQQLNLSEEEVRAILLAGLVHDLGKIRIPAEILSKPGYLDEVEMSLIKMHAKAGYDVLKDVDFAWPIAQMVLQHHERMDGSGYPQGLRGEAILLGARILCVADVLEAMASHRPYRPGLGVPAALAELERGRGTAYDPQVVDACLTLFKEKNYALPH